MNLSTDAYLQFIRLLRKKSSVRGEKSAVCRKARVGEILRSADSAQNDELEFAAANDESEARGRLLACAKPLTGMQARSKMGADHAPGRRWFVFEPKLTDPHPEAAKTYPQKVFCSLHNRDANIVVANWPMSEEGWSGWRVIDCSLLPPGAVHCGMDCLSQAKLKEE